MYKLDFARNPDLSRIILDSWLSDGKESPLGLPESAISSATSFMMVSGTTFEAKWAIEFADRYPGGFVLPDGKTKMVDMMEVTYPMQHIVSCVDYPQYEDCEPNKGGVSTKRNNSRRIFILSHILSHEMKALNPKQQFQQWSKSHSREQKANKHLACK